MPGNVTGWKSRQRTKAPLAIVGVVWRSQTGGIPQVGRFPHRFILSESANCESLSHGCAVPAPFHKGAFGCPVSLLRCSRCKDQSPPCQRGVPRHRRGGGIPQAGRFPHWLVLLESACCESLSRLRRQLPLTREPLGARYRSIVRHRAFSCFQSTAWEQGTTKSHKPKRGQRLKPTTPSQSEGSILRWLGGILKGETLSGSELFLP